MPRPRPAAAAPARLLLAITTSDFGGTEGVVRELVHRLDRSQFSPAVCSLRPLGRIGQEIAARGVPVFSLEMSETPSLRELIAGAVRLAARIDALGVDVVNAFLYRANVVAAVAARLSRRRPPVITSQRCLTQRAERRAALAARWTRHLTKRVVAVSQAVRDELIASDRVPPSKIAVIENGVDASHYRPADGAQARALLGWPATESVVGAAGRLSAEKGYHYLLDAVALARSEGTPLAAALAGDGPERERLQAQAVTLGIAEHVHWLGVQRDLRSFYAAIDMFAVTSIEEGSPNALLEAMASGRAVVAHAVGGVPEIIEPERSGILVETGSTRALAGALTRLHEDGGLRRQLAGAARRRVEERFDVARVVRAHAELYGELLGWDPQCGTPNTD